ncbi:hypothetical protein [Anaeromyxobacter oryzae]|uniref:hypothetical protein n=1 Tax=Anaeromyxobacter oryzae TaxID=2918170 RepID=UPI0020BE9510|nr:hypothetical protein [Anaeromyxobacter oryzae]
MKELLFHGCRGQALRVAKPLILFIGKPAQWPHVPTKGVAIALAYNSSQFGVLDGATGDFTFLGQD